MLKPPIPDNEAERLDALKALDILDTPFEERFDRLTRIAQYVMGVPITLISLVDAERQWFKSRQGLDVSETSRDISFCGHAILQSEVFMVQDATADSRFADNPLVKATPNIRFYAGAPLTLSNGLNVGTLCAIDYQPRLISVEQLAALRDLARCVTEELEREQEQRLARELRLIQTQYAFIIESSNDAIISKTLDGIITSWNPAAVKLFGYSAVEAIGQPMNMLIPPERVDEEANILSCISRGEDIDSFETVRIRKDGRLIDISARISPIRNYHGNIIGASKIVRDISIQKEAEIALRKSTQLVQSIVETVLDGIITIDSRGQVLSFNTAAERLFGYNKAEIIGTNIKCLMPEPYSSEHDGYLYQYFQNRKAKVIGIGREVVGMRKDHSTFPMELAISEMQQEEQSLFVGIVRDITARKQMERMKSEFVSTVSHELRTPLTSIRGALGLIMGKFASGLPNKALQLLDTAKRNAERLTLLINDILDLEKIESGKLEFEFKAIDLVPLTKQAIVANEGYGQQHNVHLRLLDTPDSAMVWADEHRLLQVFSNLISNAVKYSVVNGIVNISMRLHNGRFRVGVQNFGRGIPEEFRNRIFQRFAQADSSDDREKGGTGLGLSITKAIVERHGGNIDFLSEADVGTEFFFDLPKWKEIIQQATDYRPCLLICENDQDVAMVLSEMLNHVGISSDLVATASAATNMLKLKRYHALLLDLGLPDMDGLTLIKQLRDNEVTRDLPIIVISGHAQADTSTWHIQALSITDWLQKPVDYQDLSLALQHALHGHKRPRILHVEDDPDVVQVIQSLLEEDYDYSYALSLVTAREALENNYYDIVLLDLTLPDGPGLELLDAISPKSKIIVFSGQEPESAFKQCIASALVKGTTSNERLLTVIKSVINQQPN